MKYVTVTVFGLLFSQQIRKRFSISQVKENVKNGSFYWIFVIKLWKPWTWELRSQLKQCCPIIFAAAFWVGACVVKQSSKHCNEHKLVITWIALDTSAARLHLLMPLLNSLSLSLSSSFIIICTTNCTNRIYVQCALSSHAYFCLSLTKKWHNSCCVSMKMNKMKKPKHL